MITKENIIEIIHQIGFREKEEYDIVFCGFDDKLLWKKGERKIFGYKDYNIIIDFRNNLFELSGVPFDGLSLYFSTTSYLDTGMKDIYVKLKYEFKSEMRKILIKKIILSQ